MTNPLKVARHALVVVPMSLFMLLSGCERPGVESVQSGYRGTGMVQVYNPRTLETQAAINLAPPIADPARIRPNGPTAGAIYENVKVLGGLSIAEFGRTMDAMSAWVSPQESCLYCHVEGNFADDGKYTKIVARRMLQMVQQINTTWKPHVGQTGVTCYTCHRGQPLPTQSWFRTPPETHERHFIGNRGGQNGPSQVTALASLPTEVFATYFQSEVSAQSVRVAGTTALPTGNQQTIQQTEATYGLMTHMSKSLGVNCTFCHNSRSFASWSESSPQRSVAWYGLRMVRDINSQYLDPLSGAFPEVPVGRLGPGKDAAKLHCGTCHQGAYKPLYGAKMAEHYPALISPNAGTPPSDAASAPQPSN